MTETLSLKGKTQTNLPRIKICGLTRLSDAQLASELGAFALGFVFYPPSPRAVAPSVAAQIVAQLPEHVWKVGVFVNADACTLRQTAQTVGLTHLQLHGNESPEFCAELMAEGFQLIKALRPRSIADFAPWQGASEEPRENLCPPYLLLDAAVPGVWGGSGQTGDWELAHSLAVLRPVFLAGGLNPDNAAAAFQQVQPWALDLSSGVEAKPGQKDPQKLSALFENMRISCSDLPERKDKNV
ncbi:MAG: phosphoribosylanthranilate isomerase [Candidatus Sericytochromatia bacterium]|nr:phosphoribosylanthranilate isomerase [Candidatus Sericytochromatia bacterium]